MLKPADRPRTRDEEDGDGENGADWENFTKYTELIFENRCPGDPVPLKQRFRGFNDILNRAGYEFVGKTAP